MIRRGAHKYVRCPGDPDLLYDLESDPHELRNLAAAPEGVQVAERFRAESEERWDFAAIERDVLASQRARRLVAGALAHGAYAPWDFQPFSDASVLYVRSESARGERPGRARPEGGLPPSSS